MQMQDLLPSLFITFIDIQETRSTGQYINAQRRKDTISSRLIFPLGSSGKQPVETVPPLAEDKGRGRFVKWERTFKVPDDRNCDYDKGKGLAYMMERRKLHILCKTR